jgi:quercetin dioxygenase-like cupin family protein
MATRPQLLPSGEAFHFDTLIATTEAGISSRVLARSAGGNVTLFAFDADQALSEHTTPFDALLIVLVGAFDVTIGGSPVRAVTGTVVRLPADVPHAVHAAEPSRMLLVMLREKDA